MHLLRAEWHVKATRTCRDPRRGTRFMPWRGPQARLT